jgi:hypothetical protein
MTSRSVCQLYYTLMIEDKNYSETGIHRRQKTRQKEQDISYINLKACFLVKQIQIDAV